MTDLECFQIEMFAIGHLIRCGFDDCVMATVEATTEVTNKLHKELME